MTARHAFILGMTAFILSAGTMLAPAAAAQDAAVTIERITSSTPATGDVQLVAAAQPPAEAETEPRRRRRPPGLPPPAPRLMVAKVDALPELIAPSDVLWERATAMEVALQPQTVTHPTLETATVPGVHVVALTDGSRIAWRFSWADANPAQDTETGRFSDAVGVQFPLVEGAPYLMGAADMPVYSLYWKAQWQKDIDHGFQDVLSAYPNAWSDLYWFGSGHPYIVPASFSDERSRPWFVGTSAGNPMSDLHRATPVEEVIAEGFGTLTHVPDGIALGRGGWSEGHWHVVITRRITDDALSKLFAPGNRSEFAVAVWDGDAGNVGGRKHHSLWVQFEVQP